MVNSPLRERHVLLHQCCELAGLLALSERLVPVWDLVILPGRRSFGVSETSPTPNVVPSTAGPYIFEASNSPSDGRDLLSGMGISTRRADLMRRMSSGAWSFSSESSSEGGLNAPSRKNVLTRKDLFSIERFLRLTNYLIS